jgi:hypothetical protein
VREETFRGSCGHGTQSCSDISDLLLVVETWQVVVPSRVIVIVLKQACDPASATRCSRAGDS